LVPPRAYGKLAEGKPNEYTEKKREGSALVCISKHYWGGTGPRGFQRGKISSTNKITLNQGVTGSCLPFVDTENRRYLSGLKVCKTKCTKKTSHPTGETWGRFCKSTVKSRPFPIEKWPLKQAQQELKRPSCLLRRACPWGGRVSWWGERQIKRGFTEGKKSRRI